MQIEITKSGDLLDSRGNLLQKGWAKQLLLNYDRDKIKACKLRIKEWDYYCISNNQFGVAFTIADNSYIGLTSITVFDFTLPKEWTKSIMTPFPLGKTNLPSTSTHGNVMFQNKAMKLEYIVEDEYRHIRVFVKDFHNNQDLKGTVTLYQPKDMDTIAIVTPFHKKHRFYYNQKINCMKASGKLYLGNKILDFDTTPSYGVLDWGRGVWTYSNTWYWGSISGEVHGELFGLNMGYGFGDSSNATENALFYKKKIHKLDKITFHIPKDSYMEPWRFSSNDGRVELTFKPLIDRHSNTNLLIVKSNQHQVFGHFSGKVVLDNGQDIILNNIFGFAEKVMNRW